MAALPINTANGIKTADFADALIVDKAKIVAHEQKQTYEGTFTFDRAALEISGTVSPQ